MNKGIRDILIVLVVAALAVGLYVKWDTLPSLKDLFKPKVVTIQNTPVIVKQVRAFAQLITVSMYEEMVVDSNATDTKTLNIPLLPDITLYSHQKSLVVIGKVTTHIGIDMQKLSNLDVTGTTDSVHIMLPAAEVLDAIINPSDVTVFIEKGNWDGSSVGRLKTKIQYLAIADAQSRGLLSQSESKAKQILTDFFTAAGYKQVIIQFKNPALPNG